MILTKVLEQSSIKFSNKPALTMKMGFRSITLTYAEVYELSKKVAIFLEKNGIGKGDRVLICAPNSPYWICVFWGTLLRGAIIVPLNIQTTKKVIDKIAEQTESKIIFKHLFFKHELSQNIKQIDIEYIQDLICGFDIKDFNPVKIQEDDLFQIMYTSGTTGDPKGVMLSHKNVYSNVETVSEIIVVDLQKDRMLSILPLSHIFEQTGGFLIPFSRGVHIIYSHSYAAIRQLLKKYQITKLIGVPEFLQILMSRIESEAETKGRKKILETLFKISNKINNKFVSRILFYPILKNLGRLNAVASGGAPLDPELEKKWELMSVDVLQGYGLTETSPVVTTNNFHDKRLGSVGKVIPNVQVKIETDGEILIKGPNVFVGYYKNEQKTKESFTDDGWFKTGDIGQFDKDGFLFIKGRKKYLIKGPGGQNVYPEDIELELNKVPGVLDSCVLGLEQPNGSVEIHAAILLDSKGKFDPEEIIHNANEHLSSYQHISAYTIWPDLDFPRTVTRKIKKEEVRKFIEDKRKEKTQSFSESKKSRLIQILSQVTGIDSAKISESTKIVSELNLDSLMRVELVSWIEEDMAIVIEETDITPKTTVKDLEEILKIKKPVAEQAKLKKWPRSKWILPIRFILQQIVFALYRPFMKFKIEGLENLKYPSYPVIFMPNHISYIDSLAIARALPWKISKKTSFAAARDVVYNEYKAFSVIIDAAFNTFPISRREQENVKTGIDFIGQMLDQGFSVVVFPEGQMSKNNQMIPLKKGAGLIAVEMNVCIVPVKIIGTSRVVPYAKILPRARSEVIVRFGKPMKFKRSDSHTLALEQIEKTLNNL
jgi:long-chain acyl-CoA synthetase